MKIHRFITLLGVIGSLSIAVSAKNNNKSNQGKCWSKGLFKIPCCKKTDVVVRTTYDGEWGQEDNGKWCSLSKKSTRPVKDVPPEPLHSSIIDSIIDPAKDCDITSLVEGDSLAKEAPFRFGVGLTGTNLQVSTTVSEKMRDIIKHQFNSMTYTNLMKPLYILDKEGSIQNIKNGIQDPKLNFTSIVDGLEFAYKNGIHIRGHVLIWHTQTPDWFFNEGYTDDGKKVSPEVMESRLDSYIKQYLSFVQFNYPGVVDVWDVVNEAIEITDGQYDANTGWYTRTMLNNTPNPYYDMFGPDYVIKAFRIARKYALPNVKLVYNDFNTFQVWPHNKTQAIMDLAGILQKEDLIDGIGLQSYLGVTWPSLDEYFRGVERLATTGLELQITELTITAPDGDNWLEAQAEQYRDFFERLMKHVEEGYNIGSVTVFGLQDGYLFYASDSTKTRLLDHDLQKKPNFEAIMSILKSYKKNAYTEDINTEDTETDTETETESENKKIKKEKTKKNKKEKTKKNKNKN
jgi:GH35 family endo-1,4-beta-xylanase